MSWFKISSYHTSQEPMFSVPDLLCKLWMKSEMESLGARPVLPFVTYLVILPVELQCVE